MCVSSQHLPHHCRHLFFPQALFHVMLMFLLYHKEKYNSALGHHYLHDQALGLSPVIEPPVPGSHANTPHSVFGWWFPPSAASAGPTGAGVLGLMGGSPGSVH